MGNMCTAGSLLPHTSQSNQHKIESLNFTYDLGLIYEYTSCRVVLPQSHIISAIKWGLAWSYIPRCVFSKWITIEINRFEMSTTVFKGRIWYLDWFCHFLFLIKLHYFELINSKGMTIETRLFSFVPLNQIMFTRPLTEIAFIFLQFCGRFGAQCYLCVR